MGNNNDDEIHDRIGSKRRCGSNGEAGFTDLTEGLELTGGNLSRHLQKMEDEDCVRVEKQFVDRKPQTTYRLTETGREKFETHVQTLETLIEGVDERE